MNILAERSFPSFFKGYAPKLLKFYSDWLDWTEAPGNAQYILNSLSTEQDIDESVESYKNHLRNKLIAGFPERTATDLKLLLKNVLWLYRAKSSRKAYDFLFRVLFNSPATIWHPRDTMLKTSDGRWDVPHYVGIAEQDGASSNWLIENCLGWRMTGRSTRAEGFVGAASSGYSGSIECRASSIPDLTRVAFYTGYETDSQVLLDHLGRIECDPALKAFRISTEYPSSSLTTAVWTINKEKKTVTVPANASYVDIGTNSFLEPKAVVEGANGTYDAINLEAFDNGKWIPLQVEPINEASGQMLQAYYLDAEGSQHVAFELAIEADGRVALNQILQVRRRGQSTAESHLASFYIQSVRYASYGSIIQKLSKSAEIRLETIQFNKYHAVAKNIETNEDICSDGFEEIDEDGNVHYSSAIHLHLLFDWSDSPSESVVQRVEHFFEKPVSALFLHLSYDFDIGKYVVSLNKKVENPITAQCVINGKTFEVDIPAGSTSVEAEVSLPDPIVVVGSKNIFGILVDNPSAHFAPGEQVRLLDPDTGETSEIEPTILWYAESDGHYTSSKGFLSDINAIQDNHYWQNYSYVVQSDVGIREWRHIVKNLLHPAGLEIFAEMMLEGALEDGSGIYYLDVQTFLKKSVRFFRKMVGMARQAILKTEWIRSTSRLAQRHSITTDNWLYWMQDIEDLKNELVEVQEELASLSEENAELREKLESRVRVLLSKLSMTWMNEDIRDWYDIHPSDVDENLNSNSVLFFRNDGTLVNPLIVEWVGFNFTEDIDEPFFLRGEKVSPRTKSITGTTLHPLHPMIHGSILGNEYVLQDGQEFIPSLYMAFVGSTQESSGVIVKKLISGNEILRYFDESRTDIHEPAIVKETDLQKYARKFLLGKPQETASTNANGIIQWKELYITDFIYANTDGGLVFNAQSLLKVPDAWTEAIERQAVVDGEPVTEQAYVFERNAWNNEKISIVSYSPYDFSYRIWVERFNNAIQCTVTAYDSTKPLPLPLVNSNIHVEEESEPVVEIVHVESSGWNGPSRNVYATTKTWNLSFNDPARVSSWFNIQLPEVVDNEHILCFINGLLQQKSRIDGNIVAIDTINDNSSIVYSSNKWEFGELSLEEFVFNEDGELVLDENGNPETKLVAVSVNESDNVPFGETTLEDWLVIDESISRMRLSNFDLKGIVYNIVGCSISTAVAYAELYVLAPIEGSRKILYPWHGWKMEIGEKADGSPVYVWPFTYDNARSFQYAAHNEFIYDVKDAELNPDKKAVLPVIHWDVEYRNVSRLLNGFQHSTLISTTIASQRQSETVDRILNTWFDEDTATPRLRTNFFKNEHWMASANFSSTLLFNEEGILVDPVDIDWSDCVSHQPQSTGIPQKWWSRPILAETPVEFGTIVNGVVASSKESFKPERYLAFIDGLKVVDSDIQAADMRYAFEPEHEGKSVTLFSMGRDWTMENNGRLGYFNAVKNGSSWAIKTKVNGSYVSVQNLETINDIDLGEFVGLSMGRTLGTIWDSSEINDIYWRVGEHSSNEIKGTTEVMSSNGDKRRFIDHTFLDIMNVKEPFVTERLHSVRNNWIFGIVERIIDVDPRFFMVFIDGRHSPREAREWRYLKGTFFIDVEPQQSVEVYVGNPLSYLLPDFAKTAPDCMDHMVFNNLRTNIVPRHHIELIDSKMYRIPIGMKRRHEIEWRHIYQAGITGWFGENWIREIQVVQKQSETFDDILYWKQMLPNAWLDVEDPMKMTNKSSMLVFDVNGRLIDPIYIDWHRKTLVPSSYGNTVEILSPDSIIYTGMIYFPAWEYDETEGHILHTSLYTFDGKTEGRYRELVESNWDIVYIDNVAYNYDQWFSKHIADLHLEESVFVNEYPELSEGENLLLTDELLDSVQEQESLLNGKLHSFQIEATRQVVRSMIVGSQNMDPAIEVPSVFGAIVFVDGIKLPEGSYRQRITRDGVQYREGTSLQPSDVPNGSNVQQWIVLDGAVYGDSTEHIVHVYWPAKEYGSSIRSGNLCTVLYSNAEDVHWEGIWKSACRETYNKVDLEASLCSLLQNAGFLIASRKWTATPNGKTFLSEFGLPASPSAAQMASAIVQYKPEALPGFIRSLSETFTSDQLIELYRVFSSCIEIEAPLIEQFREYVQNRFLLFVNGKLVPVSVDSSGRIVLEIGGRHVFAEDYAPESFELYCIDLTNPVLRSSTADSTEDYQSLHFQNLRIFPHVEVDSRLVDFKYYDWKIQYFIRSTEFKTDTTIYMNRIGWYNSSRINSTTRVQLISETIDDVLKRQQMAPSAWAGLDFDILAKSSKSSAMMFSENGTLIDPADIDFSDGSINPWQTGKVVEVLLPDDILRMSNVYWPVYVVDPLEHSAPYTDSRFKELHDTSECVIATVNGLTFDIDRNLGKDLQDVHNEESAWIYPRPDHVFEPGIYSSFIEDADWSISSTVEQDAEHLLLTDTVAEEDKSVAGGSILGVSIDAEHAMYRSVQTVLRDGRFIVSVPRINGEIVFVDGIKLRYGAFVRLAIVNGHESQFTYDELDLNQFSPGDDVQFAIEILDSRWKDDDEHVVVVYWPNENWAQRVAYPANLENAVNNAIESNWKEYGFQTFKQYVQSKFILFCDGKIASFDANVDNEIFINGETLNSYRCNTYELYIVDLSNAGCRTSESTYSETEQSFTIDNQQKNIFMESHHDESFFEIQSLDNQQFKLNTVKECSTMSTMPVLSKENSFALSGENWVANNRDTMDNLFAVGSLPVRQYVNPSLYVVKTTKVEILGLDDYHWKVLATGENVDELEWLAIDVYPTDERWNLLDEENQALVNLELISNIVDGKVVYRTDYIPESWNFQLYATSRENPEWFLPCERIASSKWKFYKGWDQRLEFSGIEPEKDVYIVEILDVSMEGTIANTDQIWWLEKEFNKKSTLILDNEGLLEHPDGLEWINGIHVFPHHGTWTAQAEEPEFPAIINELVPDNVKKARIMDLCMDDMIGYDGGINPVGDASIESLVAVNARVYRHKKWEVLANKDYIFWEEGEFRNWIAWLNDDDVFDPHSCFIFINGLKIPDWMWTFFDEELPYIKIPLVENQRIARLGFVKRDDVYDETIYEQNIQTILIDPDETPVQEADYNVNVIVDANWAVWRDSEGFPVWGEISDIPESADEILMYKPDPREGIIWPISRIWKYFNSCTSEGIDIPEYLGHDLSKYVLAWVDGRNVQCIFDGTRIYVPGCETAETVEVYVFELHDGAWIERFNAIPESFTLTSFRDLKVC